MPTPATSERSESLGWADPRTQLRRDVLGRQLRRWQRGPRSPRAEQHRHRHGGHRVRRRRVQHHSGPLARGRCPGEVHLHVAGDHHPDFSQHDLRRQLHHARGEGADERRRKFPRLQTTQKAGADVHANNGTADLPGDGQGTDIATVGRGAIAIQTQVSPGSITIGSTFNDTATLTKPTIGPLPTGTVSFDVYSNPTCTGTPIFTSTNPVSAAGTSAVSNNFTAAAAGTYQVIARYSGDANWADLASRCDDPAATVAVSRATPSLATRLGGRRARGGRADGLGDAHRARQPAAGGDGHVPALRSR